MSRKSRTPAGAARARQPGEVPDDPHAAMRDAAREWDEAEAASDIAALRALVRLAFPNLTLKPARSYGDRSPGRFLWYGPRPPKK